MYRIDTQAIIDPQQGRQFLVFKRQDQSFGFEVKYYVDNQGWLCVGHYQDQYFGTLEEALEEIEKTMTCVAVEGAN